MLAVGPCREQEQRGSLRWWRAGAPMVLVHHRFSRQCSAPGKSKSLRLGLMLPNFAAMSALQNALGSVGNQTSLSLSISAAKLCIIFVQLPKLLELVGLGYSAWFVYRYLLFKVSLLLRVS